MKVINHIDDILTEWSVKVSNGTPNIKNKKHLRVLERVLFDMGFKAGEIIPGLERLDELDFDDQESFQAYSNKHNVRSSTKVTIAGKETTAGDAGAKDTEREEEPEKTKGEIEKKVKDAGLIKFNNLYGSNTTGKLLQNSQTSDEALAKGYKKGASWVAPGNAGSNFNENMSDEGAMILSKHPDIKTDELTRIIYEKSKDTALGAQQKKTIIDGDYTIPADIPKDKKDLYKASLIAARSAESKHNRTNAGLKAAQASVEFGKDTTRHSFGGTSADLTNLENTLKKAKNIYLHDEGTGTVHNIPKEIMLEWASSAGGGENAGDTVVLTQDENGNIIYDGWSDKKSLSDIQGNSTLNDDYTKSNNRLSNLLDNKRVDESTAKKASDIIQKAKKQSSDIEKGYKNAVYKEGQYLSTLDSEDKQRLINALDDQEQGYISKGTSNHVENFKNKVGANNNSQALDILLTRADEENLTADERKVLNRLANSERKHYRSTNASVPAGLDTQQIMSDARDQALAMQKQTLEKLNELSGTTKSGLKKPLGSILAFEEVSDFLHLDKINQPKDDKDYKQMLKRNTNLVMEGISVPAHIIKSALGVKSLNDLEDNFEVITEDRVIKDQKLNKYTTGSVVQIFAVDKAKNRVFIGEKRYRSKDGPTGKTSNTIQWSPEMQERFKKADKNK